MIYESFFFHLTVCVVALFTAAVPAGSADALIAPLTNARITRQSRSAPVCAARPASSSTNATCINRTEPPLHTARATPSSTGI